MRPLNHTIKKSPRHAKSAWRPLFSIGLLFYLILLTILFVFFEIGIFIHGSQFFLGDFRFIAKHLAIPFKVFYALFFFIFIQFLLHLSLIIVAWSIARLMGFALRCKEKTTEWLGIMIWILLVITILIANQYLYPNSKFATLTSFIFPSFFIKVFLILFLCVMIFFMIPAMYGLFLIVKRYTILSSGVFLSLIVTSGMWMHSHIQTIQDASSKTKPNIIFIGIDALRPDFLGTFGNSKNLMPHLDNFLEGSAVFSDALTPIARTFPAWVSILTGEYPKINGMRTDLMDKNALDTTKTLSSILQSNGYETIFAIDETRFSNIDESFGFDKIISPPMGVNDFLIGALNDFPLSNLFVNTGIGRYILPYNYANRAAYITYQPDTFIQYLKIVLKKPREKPLFLVVHFCLPHYPYTWAEHRWDNRYVFHYRSALQRADQQFFDFLNILKSNQLLEQSIVVVLSDHGEALRLSGDRATDPDLYIPGQDNVKGIIPHFYPGKPSEKVNESAGHGTDILGLTQYHPLLAFRYFGVPGQNENLIPGQVSLMDITPTILDLLKIPTHKMNGKSLVEVIAGRNTIPPQEDFFIESDFSPEAVHAVYPDTHKLLFQGIDYFQIHPKTTRITVKKSMLDMIIASKQYADFYGPWILALYPVHLKPMTPILVNLETGEWTDDLRTPLAKNAPTKHMLNALRSFFKEDIKEIATSS